MDDMEHDVFFPKSDRHIKAYAYYEGSGTKLELERVNGVFELSVEFARLRRRKAFQVRVLHFLLWNRSQKMMVKAAIVDHPN